MSKKNDKDWKDAFLKSGLPLENDVKKYLDKKGCVGHLEYSYLRPNREQELTEFSYDIDSSFFPGNHYVDLMIECKYKHPNTQWVFLPEEYWEMYEIHPLTFLHPNDYFIDNKYYFHKTPNFTMELAPLCSKGVEIQGNKQKENTLTGAYAQLSYAFADKITSGIEHQVDKLLGPNSDKTVFFTIPIVVTTAELYRIRDSVTISDIKNSTLIEEIADRHNLLVVKNSIGPELEQYNLHIFQQFIDKFGEEKLTEHNRSHRENIYQLFGSIAANDCPSSFVIIQYTEQNAGFEKFFDFVNQVIIPPQELLDEIKKREDEWSQKMEKFEEKFSNKEK